MNKFIKKYWWLLVILFIFPIIGLCIIANKITTLNQTWISLICAALTYFGTVILAFVTLIQNDKITEFSEKDAAIEEIRLRNKYHPVIDIKSIQDIKEKDYSYKKLYKNGFGEIMQIKNILNDTIYVIISNVGNASAYNIETYEYGYNSAKEISDGVELFDYHKNIIYEMEKDSSIYLTLHFEENATFSIKYNICYKNEFDNGFYNTLSIELIDNHGDRTAQIGISPQVKKEGDFELQEHYYGVP